MVVSDHHRITLILRFPDQVPFTKAPKLDPSLLTDAMITFHIRESLQSFFKENDTPEVTPLTQWETHKTTKLARLDTEIRTIKDKLSPNKESDEYRKRSLNLLKVLEKEDKEQRIKKKKKYNRDLANYQNSVVFEWQRKLLNDAIANQSNNAMETSTQSVLGPESHTSQPPKPNTFKKGPPVSKP